MSLLQQLYTQRAHLTSQVRDLEASVEKIDEQILVATRDKVQQMYALSGKQFGSVTIDGGDGISIKADIKKTVEWDSAALMKVASGLSWGVVEQTFDIKFKVPEKVYAKLDGPLLAAIDAARTTKYGDIAVKLELAK